MPSTSNNIYLSAKEVISADEARQKAVHVFGACPYPDYVTTFDTVDEFLRWSQTHPAKDRIAEALRTSDLARAEYIRRPLEVVQAQQAQIKTLAERLEQLAQKTGLDPNSRELFLKATVEADPLEGPIFRSAQLFEHPNCTGRRLDVRSFQWFPNLAAVGFDNIISSVRVHAFSFLVLCSEPNFLGRWTWFFGGLWWSNEFNLDSEVNDTASSCFCIGF